MKQLKTCREQILAANLLGGTFVYNASSRQFKEQPSTLLSTKSSNKRARTQDDDKSTDTCTGCGRTGHLRPKCQFSAAKYFNNGNGKYENSTAYALLLKDRPNHKDKTVHVTQSTNRVNPLVRLPLLLLLTWLLPPRSRNLSRRKVSLLF